MLFCIFRICSVKADDVICMYLISNVLDIFCLAASEAMHYTVNRYCDFEETVSNVTQNSSFLPYMSPVHIVPNVEW